MNESISINATQVPNKAIYRAKSTTKHYHKNHNKVKPLSLEHVRKVHVILRIKNEVSSYTTNFTNTLLRTSYYIMNNYD